MTTLSRHTGAAPAEPGATRLARLKAYLDGLDGRPAIDELLEEMKRAAVTIDDVKRWVRFDDSGYQRNLMWESEHYEALVLCWKPGQRSPIHDHAGSVCGLTVLQGRLTKTLYEEMPCGIVAPTSSASKQYGDYCASQDEQTHLIANYEATEPLVTIHIYAPKLQDIGIFDAQGLKHTDRLARFMGFMGGDGI